MKKFLTMMILALAVSGSAVDTYAAPAEPQQSAAVMSDDEIISLCKQFVHLLPSHNPYQEKERLDMAKKIIIYVTDTDKLVMNLGTPVSKPLAISDDKSDSSDLLMVYIAAETLYCLEHNLPEDNAESYAYAMELVLDHYSLMPKHNLKVLNKFLKINESDRTKALIDYYNKEKD